MVVAVVSDKTYKLGLALLAICFVGMFVYRLHHLIINAHLTEAQALGCYAPGWVVSAGLLLIGYYLLTREDKV